MTLFLLRHGDAENHASSDRDRRLTDKGIAQAEKVGEFCRKNDLTPEIILTSPYRRAETTARLAAEKMGAVEVIAAAFLASGMQPNDALGGLRGYAKFESIMLVGHEPDLSFLCASLIDLKSAGNFSVKKATLICLAGDELRTGVFELCYSIPVKLM